MSGLPVTSSLSIGESMYLLHHVFLPPQLPQQEDYNSEYESILLDNVISALGNFQAYLRTQEGEIIDCIIAMVSRLRKTRDWHGDVNEAALKEALEELDTSGGILPIHVRSQNAAVLMTRCNETIHVEAFELSPRNKAVNTTIGRLQRQFPGPTLELDRDTFRESGMQDTIAQALQRMSHQSVAGTKPKVKKAGQEHDEDRDTTDPRIVTELFTAFLRPRCRSVDSLQVHKNTRDEVLWLDSRQPWRRSPLWLLVRATVQLAFRRLHMREEIQDDLYKQFMVFFMSALLNKSHKNMRSEHRYIMNAKIARRLRKLGLHYHPTWFSFVQEALERSNGRIQKTWRNIIIKNSLGQDMSSLAGLSFTNDIDCVLPGLDAWLDGIRQGEHSQAGADLEPQSGLVEFERTELPSLSDLIDLDYMPYNLAAFESWVDSNLDDWIRTHLGAEDTCQRLGRLMGDYYKIASPLYSQNPEAMSIMLLTILELWMACDQSAIHIHPMLGHYDAHIPIHLFESLVLPHLSQLTRLSRAESYMLRRREALRYPGSNIFLDFGTPSCFSVKYFDQSGEHQNLLATIEQSARRERAEKKAELHQKRQRYRDLYALHNETDCTYYEYVLDKRFNLKETRHHPSCTSCGYKDTANSISIYVHEWPLPRDSLQAKSTVFELNLPRPFAFWRDTTAFVLFTVLHVEYAVRETPRAEYRPQTYSGLSPFFTHVDASPRIGLLSEDKPHQGTHRRNKHIIHVTENDVCLANGMHFKYFDNAVRCFGTSFVPTNKITSMCAYKLPQTSAFLQKFLFRPTEECDGPPPNTVIASQHACPEDMSLGEFKALCSMPLGIHIQWVNILRQLAAPSVLFNRVDTCIFILQIIHQTGPPTRGSVLRAGHIILNDDTFVVSLLAEINKTACVIKENWQSAQELNVLILLTHRILALSPSVEIQDICLAHLELFRAISFAWVATVRNAANNTENDQHRNDLVARSTHLALICVGTFDTEGTFLERILDDEGNASTFIQCSMTINDRKGLLDTMSNCLLPVLYYRWQILAYRCYRIVADNIVQRSPAALDQAIRRTWAAYRPGRLWSVAPGGNHCCLRTQMGCESTNDSGLQVHFNLLTGELLINGRPLARLPSKYERHKTYKTLFGRSLVEVMPSDIPGMQFSSQREYKSHQVHIGRDRVPGSGAFDLRVRALDDTRVWEFVPPRLLAGSFPDAFVEGYAHWYDVDGGYVEFRPAKAPWQSSRSHWRLKHTQSRPGWQLARDTTSLISMGSETARSLSDILGPLEKASKVHCKLHHVPRLLEIEIPRLRLSFNLRPGDSLIESRQYPGMTIDPDQSLDTLIGLRNKLILRDDKTRNRVVLIPEGDLTWTKDGDHVAVRVDWQPVTNVHVYLVNSQMGCLTDNGSVQSKLALCYLHAITSFCVPDPLSQKTGTEQSLSMLRSASMRSFNQLHPDNILILQKIAQLTPERRYYPANERVMQSIQWEPVLDCLAQHNDFREQVSVIFDQDRRMRMFAQESQLEQPPLPYANMDLLDRDRIRSSTFQTSGFGAENHTTAHDRCYGELGRNYRSEECSNVFTLCQITYKQIPSVQSITSQSLVSRLWKFLLKSGQIRGPGTPIDLKQIKYDATWFVEPDAFVSSHWCSIHRLLCSGTTRPNKFTVMIWLSTLAFSKKVPIIVLQILAAIYVIPNMASLTVPSQALFQPHDGYEVKVDELKSGIHSALRTHTPESDLSPNPGETYNKFQSRIKTLRKKNKGKALDHFIAGLQKQWPTPYPSAPICMEHPRFQDYFETQMAMEYVRGRFLVWFDNRELRQYLTDIASIFIDQPIRSLTMPPWHCPAPVQPPCRRRASVDVDDILDESLGPPPALEVEPPLLETLLSPSHSGGEHTPRLRSLVHALELQAGSDYERRYVEQLRGSMKSLQSIEQVDHIILGDAELEEIILAYFHRCRKHYEELFSAIMSRMTFSDAVIDEVDTESAVLCKVFRVFARVNMSPRVSPELLLRQLARNRWVRLSDRWKRCFVAYGRSITELQRANRLLDLISRRADLARELQNPGHSNWDPYDFPESLLLEIENGLLIRDVQENIARQMRNVQPGQNVVMQLNMGEGKSSVIVPIVAAALADGACLVRVIVAKPQSRQMFQMLVSKLGGLLGRRIYHLPISRSLHIGETEAEEIERMCQECMAEGGALLVQPEHILSLKLMCLESFIMGRNSVGICLLRTLEFFRTSSRDVVDESDENFNVKFELIYTMGAQRPLDLSPQRWILIQQMLSLVRKYAPVVKRQLPQSIEVDEHRPGSFPRTRLLHANAALQLFNRIAEHVCNNGIDTLPISRQPAMTRKAVLSYCLDPDLSEQEVSAVEDSSASGFWTASTKDSLLLLRGLLAGNILAFCFGQKRWRVNYGPDISRTPPTRLSVPYRAKDSPAPRSEFSHPDVVVVLTCLSYYYYGLCDDDLFLAFSHLVGSDQADAEYQAWVEDAPSLPSAYHDLGGINLQDRHHCLEHIFPSLRFAKGVIDYFLAHIVFPKELREFPNKLSASGWDIGEIKAYPTVGFSGTNDSRITLPLSVEQLDLQDQNHTNALVLEHILQPETFVAFIPPRDDLPRSDAQILLDMVVGLDPPTRVILDVGAQVLELTNLDLAKAWLEKTPDTGQTQAVIFVNDRDEISVVDRTGLVEPLQISPFEKNLETCLVFLDEAHTRGIDLKLPQNYRAAVTLGAGITKDKLVQACMRMRKLGKGQSVVFCIPGEIKTKIRSLNEQLHESNIDVSAVLCWAVSESWIDMQRSIPLWAVQGKRFERQSNLWHDARRDSQMSKRQAENFLEPESQSIEQRYRPRQEQTQILCSEADGSEMVDRIIARCDLFSSVSFASTQLQEEQERELAPEIEQERQVQRPPPANPEQHRIHPDLHLFVSTGVIDTSSTAVKPAFQILRDTSASKYLDVSELPSGLLVTVDFARTVQIPKRTSDLDSYQRAVEWVLTSRNHIGTSRKFMKHMIVISPYEANELCPQIAKSRAVMMHLYAPRQNRTFSPLDKLNLYAVPASSTDIHIPESLVIQLNLFAGQLYISSYNEYLKICDFLGVASVPTPEGLTVAADGFIVASIQQAETKFARSPLKFFKVLMSKIRKDGQEIDKTHLGKILDGKLSIVRQFGPPREVITCEICDPPIPGPGQVLVQMLLASINPSDLIPITGAYRARTSLPFVPGFEGVGVIKAVGTGVTEMKIGDRVLPLGSAGAWQEFKLSEERWCFPVPTDLTDQQAATAYINPLTAWMMTKEYAPTSPAPVVVNAATSAISQMIIRLLNRVGVRPIVLTRRPEVLDQLMSRSEVTAVICTSNGDLRRRISEWTGVRGLAVAYDAVGGSEGNDLAHSLAPGGTLVHYGLLSGTPLSPWLYKECPGVHITLFRLRDWVHGAGRHEIQRALDAVFDLVRDGIVESKISRVFQLASLKEALEYEATPDRKGKVLLSVSQESSPIVSQQSAISFE
ncbi:hypothetical protein FE257_006540 [Aspergillus nanangensis]|uniref:ubiquitinyl hydrolase 1 n=1 Tax=Aspergillus nanangensis TaxID=2582783 RepID=A0AAD4CY40_ASPNN|nr:hypothetical protein FE257_006540 [Aspergillus nanangensis]QGW49094.1 putative oxidoreductase [Aspergillus nanangensis]